jgi:hypothetical protein
MSKENIYKNGGFPPIKYCKPTTTESILTKGNKKERFFANAVRNELNIRQILATKSKVDPVFIIEKPEVDDIEIV